MGVGVTHVYRIPEDGHKLLLKFRVEWVQLID